MKLRGKSTINPVMFITGKLAGILVWAIYLLQFFGAINMAMVQIGALKYITAPLFLAGLFLIIAGSGKLGRYAQPGLPDGETKLMTSGVYQYSRNPMYLGFHLITLSGILLTLNPIVLSFAVYSIVAYHFIIKGEEQFLTKRFTTEYAAYQQKTGRYFMRF
jgi:protein-S-isoprenylcysteine O-methyltransferase Ste14